MSSTFTSVITLRCLCFAVPLAIELLFLVLERFEQTNPSHQQLLSLSVGVLCSCISNLVSKGDPWIIWFHPVSSSFCFSIPICMPFLVGDLDRLLQNLAYIEAINPWTNPSPIGSRTSEPFRSTRTWLWALISVEIHINLQWHHICYLPWRSRFLFYSEILRGVIRVKIRWIVIYLGEWLHCLVYD